MSCFKQETSVILETLDQQRQIIDFAQEITGQPTVLATRHRSASTYIVPRRSHGSSYSRADATAGSSYLSQERRPAAYYSSYDRDAHQPSTSHYRSVARPIIDTARAPGALDPMDPNGIQGLLVQDSYALIDRKIRDFEEMNQRADELEKLVRFHSGDLHAPADE